MILLEKILEMVYMLKWIGIIIKLMRLTVPLQVKIEHNKRGGDNRRCPLFLHLLYR